MQSRIRSPDTSILFVNMIIFYVPTSHPIIGFKDDSAYVTTKTSDRNQRSTEDG